MFAGKALIIWRKWTDARIKADDHFQFHLVNRNLLLLRTVFGLWSEYSDKQKLKRAQRGQATEHFHRTQKVRFFAKWKEFVAKQIALKNKIDQTSRVVLMVRAKNMISNWRFYASERQLRHELLSTAMNHHDMSLVSRCWYLWKRRTNATKALIETGQKLCELTDLNKQAHHFDAWRKSLQQRDARRTELSDRVTAQLRRGKLEQAFRVWHSRYQQRAASKLISKVARSVRTRHAFKTWRDVSKERNSSILTTYFRTWHEFKVEQTSIAASHHGGRFHRKRTRIFHQWRQFTTHSRLLTDQSRICMQKRQREQIRQAWRIWRKKAEQSMLEKQMSSRAAAHFTRTCTLTVVRKMQRFAHERQVSRARKQTASVFLRQNTIKRWRAQLDVITENKWIQASGEEAARRHFDDVQSHRALKFWRVQTLKTKNLELSFVKTCQRSEQISLRSAWVG